MSAAPTVLVDVDGTLVDTNYLHVLAWHRALAEHGIVVPSARLHRLIGMGGDQLLGEVVGEERPDLEDAWTAQFDALVDEAKPLEGAVDLLRTLHERGATVVLATSGPAEIVARLRELIGGDEFIDAQVSSSEVEASKPAPDIFRLAMERAGASAEATVVVGDTVWDIHAARACGIPTVSVTTGGIDRHELEEAGAAAVYEDLSALLADIDASPIGKLLNPADASA